MGNRPGGGGESRGGEGQRAEAGGEPSKARMMQAPLWGQLSQR